MIKNRTDTVYIFALSLSVFSRVFFFYFLLSIDLERDVIKAANGKCNLQKYLPQEFTCGTVG